MHHLTIRIKMVPRRIELRPHPRQRCVLADRLWDPKNFIKSRYLSFIKTIIKKQKLF